MVGGAGFERSFEFACDVQVKYVGDGGIIGCIMLHFKSSTLIRRNAENSQVSVTQFQERVGAGFDQTQCFGILANAGKPKVTVSTILIFEVFYRRMRWV